MQYHALVQWCMDIWMVNGISYLPIFVMFLTEIRPITNIDLCYGLQWRGVIQFTVYLITLPPICRQWLSGADWLAFSLSPIVICKQCGDCEFNSSLCNVQLCSGRHLWMVLHSAWFSPTIKIIKPIEVEWPKTLIR